MSQPASYSTVANNGLVTYDFAQVKTSRVNEEILSDCTSRVWTERLKAVAFAVTSFVLGLLSLGLITTILSSKAMFFGTIAVLATIYHYSDLNEVFDYILFPIKSVQTHWQRADHYKLQAEHAFQKRLTFISSK